MLPKSEKGDGMSVTLFMKFLIVGEYMKKSEKKKKLASAMNRALRKAEKWSKYDRKLWSEDMFRYIIVRELEKDKIWGQLAGAKTDSNPKLFLERSYRGKNEDKKTHHKEIDVVSLYTDVRTLKGTRRNELAIEVKAKSISWKDWTRKRVVYKKNKQGKIVTKDGKNVIKHKVGDIKRIRDCTKKDRGNLVFNLAVAVNGGPVTDRDGTNFPHKNLSESDRGSNLLIGWLEGGKPKLMWYKESS